MISVIIGAPLVDIAAIVVCATIPIPLPVIVVYTIIVGIEFVEVDVITTTELTSETSIGKSVVDDVEVHIWSIVISEADDTLFHLPAETVAAIIVWA